MLKRASGKIDEGFAGMSSLEFCYWLKNYLNEMLEELKDGTHDEIEAKLNTVTYPVTLNNVKIIDFPNYPIYSD